jgi:hypothetical protein
MPDEEELAYPHIVSVTLISECMLNNADNNILNGYMV